jgi:hypothetical protein
VVVAKVGDKIAKVQCKQCGGYHRHRPPGGTKSSRSSKPRSSSTSSSGGRRKSAAQATPRIDEPQVAANLAKPPQPYSFNETYEPGDRIEHPKFGSGVVEIAAEPGKIQVFFADGRRILAIAKRKSTLERPAPFRDKNDGGPAGPAGL